VSFRYLLAFGTNVGNRNRHLDEGVRFLSSSCEFLRFSQRLETTPLPSEVVDVSDHCAYLNMVAEVRSTFAPQALYERIVVVEDALGHPRDRPWQPRALDVDILLCALENPTSRGFQSFERCLPFRFLAESSASPSFSVPHSGMGSRPFLTALVVDDLKVPQACVNFHLRIPFGND
jgi:2-amino-4-hydroxy-6-hydroxymethyldihydropteridine diphosphokinase